MKNHFRQRQLVCPALATTSEQGDSDRETDVVKLKSRGIYTSIASTRVRLESARLVEWYVVLLFSGLTRVRLPVCTCIRNTSWVFGIHVKIRILYLMQRVCGNTLESQKYCFNTGCGNTPAVFQYMLKYMECIKLAKCVSNTMLISYIRVPIRMM